MSGAPVVGLDMSANSAAVVVLCPSERVLCATTIVPGVVGPARLHKIFLELTRITQTYGPFQVAVREGYAMGATNRPYLLGEVGGITQAVLYPYTGLLTECAPKALKKFAASNACASKREVMDAVRARYGFDTDSDDIADAYALARVALCLANYVKPSRRDELEVLEVIRAGAETETPRRKKSVRVRKSASVQPYEV